MGTHRRTYILWLPLAAACTYAGIWWQTEATRWKPLPGHATAHAGGEFARVAWRIRAPDAQGVALDPTGSHAAIAGPDGMLRILDASGHTVAQRSIRSVDSVALTGPGDLAVAFRRDDESDTLLHFLRLSGSSYWEFDAGEAIVDVSLSLDGTRAACITRGGRIYSFSLGERPAHRRWQAVGSPRQVYVFPDGDQIAVATSNPPGVRVYQPDGSFSWRVPNQGNTEGEARLFPGPGGGLLACSIVPDPGEPRSRFMVMSAAGRQQWGAILQAVRPEVALSADGRYAAFTYTRVIASRGQRIEERRMMLFEADGIAQAPVALWEHGGPFYDPRLVCIAADGSFVASRDARQNIHFFGLQGELLWRHRASAPIVSVHVSTDGRALLIYSSDGALNLLRTAAPDSVRGSPSDPAAAACWSNVKRSSRSGMIVGAKPLPRLERVMNFLFDVLQ